MNPNNEHPESSHQPQSSLPVEPQEGAAMRAINQDGRIIRAARMLPMDGPLQPTDHDAVRAHFKQHCALFKVTEAQAAKQVGYSASVINQWGNGSYAGDNDEVTRAINNWIDHDQRARRLNVSVPYIPTKVAEGMRNLVKLAHALGKMAVVVMPSGTGKTMMLELLAQELRGFQIYAHSRLNCKQFLLDLAGKVGAPTKYGANSGELMAVIVARLRGSKRPILIDEAQLLSKEVFAMIRAIHDQTQVSVVMAGTDQVISFIDDRSGGRGQFARRCLFYDARAYYLNIEEPGGGLASGKPAPLFSKEEIRGFLESHRLRVDPDAFELMWAIACMPNRGCLGLLGDLVRTLRIMLKDTRERITRQHVWEAMELSDLSARATIIDNARVFIDQMRKVA